MFTGPTANGPPAIRRTEVQAHAPRPRRIAVVSSSRADYGHLYWVLRELRAAADVDLRIIVTAAHLSPRFGRTVDCIRDDGFEIAACIESLVDSDTDTGMARTIGLTTLGLADRLGELRPDLLLIIADRYEMLAPAATALALRIPIAHIEGGEISEGAIDDAVRNALTQMSHLHFVSTPLARRRVMAMGVPGWRVHHAGAPSIDHLRRSTLPDRGVLEARLQRVLDPPPRVVAMHPTTWLTDTAEEARALFAALEAAPAPSVFCFPNADAGHEPIIEMARDYCRRHDAADLYVNLGTLDYWGLLRHASLLIGNSSSGIMESPSLGLPCVNVGIRQRGRERAANVIDVAADADAIVDAMRRADSATFRRTLEGLHNPYGDGTAAETIARVLRTAPLDEDLRIRRALPLVDGDAPAFDHGHSVRVDAHD
jgi:UDP-N-acetylglucosamine 2-epimerase (non-hydrolysing)/GDP/UDP-N,N'-diacetylbacillosamine 2-epimerase (hydrolysing)